MAGALGLLLLLLPAGEPRELLQSGPECADSLPGCAMAAAAAGRLVSAAADAAKMPARRGSELKLGRLAADEGSGEAGRVAIGLEMGVKSSS
jgi:hypothetical protein